MSKNMIGRESESFNVLMLEGVKDNNYRILPEKGVKVFRL